MPSDRSARASVTLADAGRMKVALQAYWDAHPAESRKWGDDVSLGEAWIDDAGTARMGLWLLETDGETIVLAKRLTVFEQGRTGYRLLARLKGVAGGPWEVTEVTTQRVLPKRSSN